jgi:hypothetical protein
MAITRRDIIPSKHVKDTILRTIKFTRTYPLEVINTVFSIVPPTSVQESSGVNLFTFEGEFYIESDILSALSELRQTNPEYFL